MTLTIDIRLADLRAERRRLNERIAEIDAEIDRLAPSLGQRLADQVRTARAQDAAEPKAVSAARLVIPRRIHDAMVAHARSSDDEVCGLLGGHTGVVTEMRVIGNVAEHTAAAYRMDPEQQLATFQAWEDAGIDVVAFYHSHPMMGPIPSGVDLAEATYPDTPYVIVGRRPSPMGRDAADRWYARAWYLRDDGASEIPIEIAESDAARLEMAVRADAARPPVGGALVPALCTACGYPCRPSFDLTRWECQRAGCGYHGRYIADIRPDQRALLATPDAARVTDAARLVGGAVLAHDAARLERERCVALVEQVLAEHAPFGEDVPSYALRDLVDRMRT